MEFVLLTSKNISLLLLLLLVMTCFAEFRSDAQILPDDEVEALKAIATKLNYKDWNATNVNSSSCNGLPGLIPLNKNYTEGGISNVTCNCTFNSNTTCHVTNINLTRNYLNGTIPPEWGSTQLVDISLPGNRLTGSIPKELGNITTLRNLTVEFNQLSGNLPPELGNLSHIETLRFSSNYFTGELPTTFSKLNTLKDIRISDNNFTGPIPNFIKNWANLERLEILASGLEGPIPPGIASLKNITHLRISDLNGTNTFPPVNDMTKLEELILRSCNITGNIPEYLGYLQEGNLKVLDLSFNRLSGEIPSSFKNRSGLDFLFLTGNLLVGSILDRITNRVGKNIDLSYNNFTSEDLSTLCQEKKIHLNLFRSSLGSNNSGIDLCSESPNCLKTIDSFHINCGGKVFTNGNTKYEGDTYQPKSADFFKSDNWAFSSTGDFMDDHNNTDSFIWTNKSALAIKNSELYMDARLSPLSLTYYGFCLRNGSYEVKLHFAETMFTDDKTYSSLGRRKFDVYIQGKLELKDFNIEDEAGGVGKEIIKKFTAVVNSSTLEIRFYWAGKGTTAIPKDGVYGPLISAISVNLEKGSSISTGAIVGIVVAVAFVIFIILGIVLCKGRLRHRYGMEQDLKGLDLQTGSFTLRQIKAATNNFDAANKIGEGGFGPVYKGLLSDGTRIAVKQLSSKSKQGNREFVNEIGMISALQHPHLVKLYGCCVEGDQLILVYEYMENNSLARALFGLEECQLKLNWPTRHKICVGIARGLAFLHEESRLKIVHRDIKATNVLLDENLNPKISDFGLAKLDEEDNTHISTRIAGTYGYMAPEYAMWGHLTDKADVYSFGIVALEIVCGRSNIFSSTNKPKDDILNLLDWARILKEEGTLMELVDPRLGSDFNKEEVMVMINVALLCTNVSPLVRPTMSSVVSMLEGRAVVQEFVSNPSATNDEMELKAMRNKHQHSQEHKMSESLVQGMSIDSQRSAASTSAPDLYPINLDSTYWENRD